MFSRQSQSKIHMEFSQLEWVFRAKPFVRVFNLHSCDVKKIVIDFRFLISCNKSFW